MAPPLSDEHIVPFALNGALVLPAASCIDCADITKKFEQSVARLIYGTLRIKRQYRTRRPRERPKTLPLLTANLDGVHTQVDVPVADFPNVFLAVDAPPPGILTGAEPSDRNPELTVSIKGDPSLLEQVLQKHGLQNLVTTHHFDWAAFFRQLAKIGHSYAYACTNGEGYEPLLPSLILGHSGFLSHYVGGNMKTSPSDQAQSDLSLSITSRPSGDYLVAGVQLFGVGTLHPYQVVVGRVPDLDRFLTLFIKRRSAA